MINKYSTRFIVLLLTLIHFVSAHTHDDEDMDMGSDSSMDMDMNMAHGTMKMYAHFTLGDALWFDGWVPQSSGAMVGACIGLCLLAMFDRWLAALRAVAEAHWRVRAQIEQANRASAKENLRRGETRSSSVDKVEEDESSRGSTNERRGARARLSIPFIPAHDIARGALHAVQSAISLGIMLAVMTFNVGFFLAIVFGLGVGETLFGRFGYGAHIH